MQILSVADLVGYINAVCESDPILSDVWIEGEVANWSRPNSGHCYWSLRDGDAQFQAVCWKQQALKQPRLPINGEQVLVHGRVAFYAGTGKLQVYVDLIRPAGIGKLQAQIEALKQQLEGEGLFAPERKRPLPPFPTRIGIVTSPTGAALRDMLSVLRARWPLAEVVLAPALVQGDSAPMSLVEALYGLYDLPLDVIIVARGGGSIEDLWAFNDESVARAIFASPVPVITGVGHETDTTIVDYVADLRAPTPSVAASAATPDIAALGEQVFGLASALRDAIGGQLATTRDGLTHTVRHLQRLSPQARLARDHQTLAGLRDRLVRGMSTLLTIQRLNQRNLAQQLDTLSPRATLARGYAIVRRADGSVLLDPASAVDHEALQIELRNGVLQARADRSGGAGES